MAAGTSLPDQLDCLGASFRKAGAVDYISLSELGETVRLLGPPRERPRRLWEGPAWQALELLASLPNNAGVTAIWRAIDPGNAPLVPPHVAVVAPRPSRDRRQKSTPDP